MIRIYGITTSRASRCLWMLEELGVAYEQIAIDHRAGEHLDKRYAAINPNKHLPALVDGDVTLWESMAINLYLAEKYGGSPLWPDDAAHRGRVYQWLFWGMTEAEELLLATLRHRVMYPPERREAARADTAEGELQPRLDVLEGALTGRDYLLGADFTVADLGVADMFRWGRIGKVDFSRHPDISRWLDACLDRPAHKRVNERRGSLESKGYKPDWKFE